MPQAALRCAPMLRSLFVIVALCLGACSRQHKVVNAKDSVRFTYRGPDAVFLAGEFNGWSTTATPMQRKGGDWIVDLLLEPGKYQYKFVINGEWYQDSSNPDSVPDGWNGNNSVMTVPASAVSPFPAQTPPAVAARLSESNSVRQVRWRSIDYPEVPIPGASEKKLSFRVSSGGEGGPTGEPEHLRFDLIWSGLDNVPPPESLSHPEEIRVRLHLGAAGFVTAARAESKGWDAVGNGHNSTFSRMFVLPWPKTGSMKPGSSAGCLHKRIGSKFHTASPEIRRIRGLRLTSGAVIPFSLRSLTACPTRIELCRGCMLIMTSAKYRTDGGSVPNSPTHSIPQRKSSCITSPMSANSAGTAKRPRHRWRSDERALTTSTVLAQVFI